MARLSDTYFVCRCDLCEGRLDGMPERDEEAEFWRSRAAAEADDAAAEEAAASIVPLPLADDEDLPF